MAKAKPLMANLLAELEAVTPTRKTWLDNVTPEQRELIAELKRMHHQEPGRFSKTAMYQVAVNHGVKVRKDTFREWLNAKD